MPFFRSHYSKDLHTEITLDIKSLSKLFSRLSSPDVDAVLPEPRSIPESAFLRRCSTSGRRIGHKIPHGDHGIKIIHGKHHRVFSDAEEAELADLIVNEFIVPGKQFI
jgi:hypothetical protein